MKRSELKSYLREEIISVLSETTSNIKSVTEDEEADMDKQASKSAKKGGSISKISAKLAETVKDMKSVVSKWKKAEEGPDKEKLKNRLKELSKIKKELEGLL
jgi:formiminotetrahydrofolate cyclodeaminase